MSDDRKKSWREIDRARESGSGRTRRDPDEARRERASQSSAYGAYKSKLDQLFQPGGAELPEALREKLGPQPEEGKARRDRLAALRKDPGAATLAVALDAGDPLPPEPRLLMRLMEIREPRRLLPVLDRLIEALDEGASVNATLLNQRLQAVEMTVDDDDVTDRLSALRSRLA